MDSKLILTILWALLNVCCSQLIIPKRPLGYVYASGSNDALIHLDIHMGPLCPDSRDVFPVAKQVADHYGPTSLKLTLHMFPLPYHQQAYLTAKGAQIVRKQGSGDATAYRWFEYIYANLDKFSNYATANMTTNDVISMLSAAAMTLGIDDNTFKAGMADYGVERATRAAWKYSCLRAVAETPKFMLNDVTVSADTVNRWTLNDWQHVIDPLLQSSPKIIVGRSQNQIKSNKDCPADTKKCEYLPNKIECCTKGEACIPNVGCRCFDDSCSSRVA